MMALFELLTWFSIVLLGPGAMAVFIWFLRDLRAALQESSSEPPVANHSGKTSTPV